VTKIHRGLALFPRRLGRLAFARRPSGSSVGRLFIKEFRCCLPIIGSGMIRREFSSSAGWRRCLGDVQNSAEPLSAAAFF
jgi:hypothetical protein